ncbi:hypothetical protein BDZ94DRAFT_1269686 [Collybia nuda]|uniref:DUF6699 domain-containing protein n=1 Tax=Collybia nuda TaxID=64659 RepID=A0A9P6CE67_9AGAR|nr:hypothetical protein BDZ94DRAFT_1269686 [Collybia nuda]
MSNPYVYSPFQYPSQYQETPYYYTPNPSTPFILDANLYNSPYSNASSLPGTSSNLYAPNTPTGVVFPSSGDDEGYGSAWGNIMRQRRPSWNGTPGAPFLSPQPFPVTPIYNRRNSFENNIYAQSFRINPWINGEAPRGDFFFDLAPTAFLPVRLFGGGHSALLAPDQLQEPATYPTLTRLRIVCDMIPHWSIDLEFNGYGATTYHSGVPPPITLADVLVAIHRSLHRRIAPVDWQRLGPVKEREVGKAYTRRCRAAGNRADYEFAQGVKRVDFLVGLTKMLGLVRGGKVDGWDVMKLIVIKR